MTPKPLTLSLVNLRRRVLPLATTAASALLLSNCGTPTISLNTDQPADLHSAPVSPQDASPARPAASSANDVDAYTANAAEALARLDARRKTAAVKPAPAEAPVAAPPSHPAPAAPATVTIAPIPPAPAAPPAPKLFTPSMQTIYDLQGPLGGSISQLLAAAQDPTPVVQQKPAEITTDSALEFLRKQTAERPSLSSALALALLEQSLGKPHDSSATQGLPVNDQQLVTELLTALDGMNSAPGNATLNDRAAPLVELAKKFEPAPVEPDLNLPKLALASRVESYGVYTPVEPKFKAGEKHTVIVYCEVANFASKKSAATTGGSGGGQEWYETFLTQQETLATDDGLLVWRPNAEEVHDRSLNQRRDFYLVKKLTIPDNLAAGKYSLRMSVTDKTTNKIAIVTLPIEITAATKSTAKAN